MRTEYTRTFFCSGVLSRKWFLVGLLGLLLVAHVLCLGRFPAPGGDEVQLAATARSLVENGEFRQPYKVGSHGYHIRDYSPPVVTLGIALVNSVLGFGVWQTKLATMLFGLGSTFLVGAITGRLCGQLGPRLISMVIFGMSTVSFWTWQSGRYEPAFVCMFLLSIYLAMSAADGAERSNALAWYGSGAALAAAVVAYYPFIVTTLVTGVLILLRYGGHPDRVSMRRNSLLYALGAATVTGLMLVHILRAPELFWIQAIGRFEEYAGTGASWIGLFMNVLGEQARYKVFALQWGGGLDILLAAGAIVVIARSETKSGYIGDARFVLYLGLIWLGFLALYTPKHPMYFAPVVALVSIVIGVAFHGAGGRSESRWFKPLLVAVVTASTLKLGVVVYTVVHQWEGRDYAALSRMLKQAIPNGASVAGQHVIWYALAGHAGQMRLYADTGRPEARAHGEEPALNEEPVQIKLTHAVLDRELWQEPRLDGFKEYILNNFTLKRKLRLPFSPLPWAPNAPLDLDVYQRDATPETPTPVFPAAKTLRTNQ